MYLPAHFKEERIEVLHALMRARPLMALVTVSGGGDLAANHLPAETTGEPAPFGSIRGHIARGNPLWRDYRAGSAALAIFQGPGAYVSPSLYPSKAQTGEVVPTWDYVVVHAGGTLRFFHEAEWLRPLVARLTTAHEASRAAPWTIDDAPRAYIDKMLGSIVGFELAITQLTGKWKISQNRSLADRGGVGQGLRAAGDADSREIADLIAQREAPPKSVPR